MRHHQDNVSGYFKFETGFFFVIQTGLELVIFLLQPLLYLRLQLGPNFFFPFHSSLGTQSKMGFERKQGCHLSVQFSETQLLFQPFSGAVGVLSTRLT